MPIPHGWRLFTLFLLGTTWSITASAETGQPLWRFAHPNAKTLVGLEVGRIRQAGLQSGTTGWFEKTWLENLAGHLPGLEFLNQVDQVFISSPGCVNPDDAAEPPVLVMVLGRFDPAKVRQLLRKQGAKPQMFDGITVFRPQGKAAKEFAFAVLDAGTILAGDAQSIFSSIERLRLPAEGPTSAIAARAESFKSNYDFWAVMTEPSVLTSQRLPLGALSQSALMQGVSGIELGVSLREGLTLTGSLLMATDQDARTLKEEFSKLLKLAAKDHATRPELAQIVKKLRLDLDGAAVKFSLRMAKSDLEASLRKLQVGHRTTASVLIEPVPILPAEPQVIRIEGLDEGPREIKIIH